MSIKNHFQMKRTGVNTTHHRRECIKTVLVLNDLRDKFFSNNIKMTTLSNPHRPRNNSLNMKENTISLSKHRLHQYPFSTRERIKSTETRLFDAVVSAAISWYFHHRLS